jgi:hypothetical protein
MTPADSLALVESWLLSIAGGVVNAPTRERFEITAMAVAVACHDVPAALFTKDALIAALRTFEAWPSAATVYQFIRQRSAAFPTPIVDRPPMSGAPDRFPPAPLA